MRREAVSRRAAATQQLTTRGEEETRHSNMDPQAQDVMRHIILKLGGLESSARTRPSRPCGAK